MRTKANTEDPKVTVFKREERTPWVKMSVPRHPPVQQPLITTDDLSLVASHNPAEVYSPFQLLPFTTCFLPERCTSSAKGVNGGAILGHGSDGIVFVNKHAILTP